MSVPRSSTSPHPPPHASTSYLPQTNGQDSEDPFLAQTAAIPLTDRDRQEGYDVELLNARPRGAYSDGDGDSLNGRGEKFGAGTTSVEGASGGGGKGGAGATASNVAPGPAAVALPGVALGAATGAGAGAYGATEAGYGAGKEGGYGSAGEAANSRSSGTTARTGQRRPWFLRPLPLGILIGFIVAVALAIGLGVGLSEKYRHSSNSNDSANSRSSLASGSRSRSSISRTRSGTATTGTVVPSSLYSSYTSDHPQSESLTTDVDGTSTELIDSDSASETAVTTIPSPASGTTLATTGNLPIPAGSATTISGSITVSRLSPSEASAASYVTITARARAARRWVA